VTQQNTHPENISQREQQCMADLEAGQSVLLSSSSALTNAITRILDSACPMPPRRRTRRQTGRRPASISRVASPCPPRSAWRACAVTQHSSTWAAALHSSSRTTRRRSTAGVKAASRRARLGSAGADRELALFAPLLLLVSLAAAAAMRCCNACAVCIRDEQGGLSEPASLVRSWKRRASSDDRLRAAVKGAESTPGSGPASASGGTGRDEEAAAADIHHWRSSNGPGCKGVWKKHRSQSTGHEKIGIHCVPRATALNR
jgi:hypothetical protein